MCSSTLYVGLQHAVRPPIQNSSGYSSGQKKVSITYRTINVLRAYLTVKKTSHFRKKFSRLFSASLLLLLRSIVYSGVAQKAHSFYCFLSRRLCPSSTVLRHLRLHTAPSFPHGAFVFHLLFMENSPYCLNYVSLHSYVSI